MILVIGEALIDLIGRSDSDQYQAVVGGANANVALALAIRGENQAFLGRISQDGFGQQIRAHLSSHGVNLEHSITAEEQTTLAVATIGDSGSASYSFYMNGTADWGWTSAELPNLEKVIQLGSVAIQFGCLGMAVGPGNLVIEKWLIELAPSNRITFSHDLNIRPAIGLSREQELARVTRINQLSHIIKASDADLEWLFNLPEGADLDEIAREWSVEKLLVITRGSEGVSLYRSGERTDVKGLAVSLVDTVGAGDTFMANFLAELQELGALGENPKEKLASLGNEALVQAAKFANAAAALVCERVGCQPPTKEQVLQRLRG